VPRGHDTKSAASPEPDPRDVLLETRRHVTNNVKDLVIGSDRGFDDRGTQALKGVPGEWHLWRAV